jgi:hypothetical protein
MLRDFFKELWEFLRTRKKYWLTPLVLLIVLLGGLIILLNGDVATPFIYTLF